MSVDRSVSRETRGKFEEYADLVRKWSPKINIVSRNSLSELERRHIEDSFETVSFAPQSFDTWLDLGSGGGFPGIIAAIVYDANPEQPWFTLVEADARKSAFLRAVARELGLRVNVHTARIEKMSPTPSDVITARALASLVDLLEYALPHTHQKTRIILPKGVTWERELPAAQDRFRFSLDVHPSLTQEGSVNLVIQDLARA